MVLLQIGTLTSLFYMQLCLVKRTRVVDLVEEEEDEEDEGWTEDDDDETEDW